MKRIIIITIGVLSTHFGFTQLDRSRKPAPAPAKEFEIGEYEKFTLKNGLTVIVVENRKLPRVAFSLIIDRDPILEGDKVGYASMSGQILRNGTTSRSKAQLDEEVDFIGASLSTSSTSIFGSSLTKHREKLLDLFTDVLYNPSFPEEELSKIKKQTISGLKSSQDDPGAISANVRAKLLYGEDHPYGEIQLEKHVEAITIDDLKNYYETYFKPNISYLAIVGDISVKEAKKIAKKRFEKWERGEVPGQNYDQPEPLDKNRVAIVNRSNSVQTVLNINYPIDLKPGTPEFIKARVMNQVLGGGSAARFFKNIREDKGYTYGAYSSISSDEQIGNFNARASVRTEVTDSSVYEFLYEMRKIRSDLVPEEELQLAKNVIIGGFGRSLESPQTIASFAINLERYNLPSDYYNNYTKNIQSVTSEEVNDIANQYIRPEKAYIVAVGKASEISDGLAQFGEVKHYDIYGNEVDPSLAKIPDGVTAKSVLEKYIEAIGGKDQISKLNSMQMKMEASVMGQTMNMDVRKVAPNKSLLEVKMAGNVVQRQVFDGKTGKMSGMGGEKLIEGEEALDMEISSAMVEELFYLEKGLEIKIAGVESIGGEETYAVEVVAPSGKTSIRYYSADTGYLIRASSTVDSPQGSMTLSTDFGEYKEFNGVYFPTQIQQPINPQMKMDISVTEVLVNEEIAEDIFNVE